MIYIFKSLMSYKITETQERFYVEVLVGVKATDSELENTHTLGITLEHEDP